jgi:integral membrane protein
MENKTPASIKRLKFVALLEGISFLVLLFIAMPLKYFAEEPWLNKQVGLAHGVLFVLYVILVIEVKIALEWSMRKTFIALGASIVPFGTFYINEKWMKRK